MAGRRLWAVSDGVYGGFQARWEYSVPDLSSDDRVERQRCLRTFLESAVANLALRRLCRSELQWAATIALFTRCGTAFAAVSIANPGCNNGLEHVVDWFTYPVERHERFLHGFRYLYSKLQSADIGKRNRRPSRLCNATRLQSRQTTGSSASVCIAISIPDRGVAI